MTLEQPRPLVVDASVAIAICIEEPTFERAVAILREREVAGARVLAPAFLWLEILNVLIRRYHQPPELVLQSIVDLETLGLTSVELDRPQVLLTLDLLGRHRISAYDASYLALAESVDGDLLTLDHQLAAAAGSRALPITGRRAFREIQAPYEDSWVAWPGAAAYLKELRAQMVAQANG
jgi:predicted nucleic acid-binding protein